MSVIVQQLNQYKEVAKISAEFSDMVSAEALAELTVKSITRVKEILKEENVHPIGHFGKSPLYSKKEVLKLIKKTA